MTDSSYSVEGQMTIFDWEYDQDSWCGKTFPEPSAATKEKTSKRSSQKSSKSLNRNVPMCLCLTKENGPNRDVCTMKWGGWSVAWRVHDAQFWGVPQRRKRIALVADFGGMCAPEVLFERKGLSRDFEQSGEEGEETSTDSERSTGESDSGFIDGTFYL